MNFTNILFLILLSTSAYCFSFNFFESEKISQLKDAIEKDSNNVDLHIKLAQEYAKESYKSQDIEKLEKCNAEIKIARSLSPMNLKIIQMEYFFRADLLIAKKDEELLNELYSLFEILKASNISVVPPSYLKASITPYNKETSQQYINFLKEAIKENKQFYDSYYYLADAYNDNLQYDLSIFIAKLGIKIKPDFGELYYIQAMSTALKISEEDEKNTTCKALDKKLMTNSIQLLQKAIQLNPKNIEAKRLLSKIYFRNGQNKLSIYILKQIVQNEQNNNLTLSTLAYRYLSDFELEKAKIILKDISSDDTDIDDYNNSTFFAIFILEENWDKVIEYFKKLSSEYKTFYRYIDYVNAKNFKFKTTSYAELDTLLSSVILSDWQIKIKNYYQGKINKDELLSFANNNCKKSEALYTIAMHTLVLGNKEDAKKYFQKIIDLKIYSYEEYIRSQYYLKNLERFSSR